MTNLTVVQTSLDPEQGSARARRRTSIAARIGSMGQNRIGALLLLVGTLAAIIWANMSLASYETFWETHLMVGVGDLQLNFTPHALVNDALMAIFFFTVGLEVRREFAIGELTSWFRAMVPVAAAISRAWRWAGPHCGLELEITTQCQLQVSPAPRGRSSLRHLVSGIRCTPALCLTGSLRGRPSLRPQPGHLRERRLAVSLTGSMGPVLIAASRWHGS